WTGVCVILGPPQAEPGIHFHFAGSVAFPGFSVKIKMDLLAPSWRLPCGPSAAPMFAFGNPASAPGSPLRGVQDDERNVDPCDWPMGRPSGISGNPGFRPGGGEKNA